MRFYVKKSVKLLFILTSICVLDLSISSAYLNAQESVSGTSVQEAKEKITPFKKFVDEIYSLFERAALTLTEWETHPRKSKITIRQLLTFTSGLDPTVARWCSDC